MAKLNNIRELFNKKYVTLDTDRLTESTTNLADVTDKVIESGLNVFIDVVAEHLVELEKRGYIINLPEVIQSLNKVFNTTMAEQLAVGIINQKTHQKIML